MFSKLLIIGVILTVTYCLPKEVRVLGDHSNSLDSKEKSKTNKGCKIANCDLCNVNKKSCISCSVGWGRNAVGTCSACGANCKLCSLNFKVCTECLAPTVNKIIGGQCKKCELSNCEKCNDDLTKCNVCAVKYGLNNDYKCQACNDLNCESCHSDFNKCEICKVDFEINSNGKCFQSGQCLSDGKRYCLNEFGIDPLNPFICKKCAVANCFHCNDDYKVCNVCNQGFKLDASNKCIECAMSNCLNCLMDVNTCQLCKDGFNFEHYQCLKCATENCHFCPTSFHTCEICNVGFALNYLAQCIDCFNSTCGTCSFSSFSDCSSCNGNKNLSCNQCTVDNCFECDPSSECYSCLQGYYLENNTCIKYCANCTELSFTMQCNHLIPGNGEYKRISAMGLLFGNWQGCDDVNCQYCFFDNSVCEACQDGYILDGTICRSALFGGLLKV